MTGQDHRKPMYPNRIVEPRSSPLTTPKWRGNLPHIYKEGCTFFVTFCLVDAVPERRRQRRLKSNVDLDNIEQWYDPPSTTGSCILRDSRAASIVENALLHFQGERYSLSAWSVMPNHVHTVVTPNANQHLSKILHSWKSFSAHEINKVLGRNGSVWEKESFDHLVRSERAFERFVAYTEKNPVVAGLCDSPELWPFGSARSRCREL